MKYCCECKFLAEIRNWPLSESYCGLTIEMDSVDKTMYSKGIRAREINKDGNCPNYKSVSRLVKILGTRYLAHE